MSKNPTNRIVLKFSVSEPSNRFTDKERCGKDFTSGSVINLLAWQFGNRPPILSKILTPMISNSSKETKYQSFDTGNISHLVPQSNVAGNFR